MASARVLVYGGKGALGAACVNQFKQNDWWVGCIDLFPNEEAHCNITIEAGDSWVVQEQQVCSRVEESLNGEKVDAILCVAGGWAGGSASSKALVKNCDLMWKQSVWSSTIAAHLASKHLKDNGTLVLTGAHPALQGTPGMIGYGMAKAAVHQLVKSLAEPKSGLPEGAFVTAILPVTLDTPMNRKNMPNADFSSWTPLDELAKHLLGWTRKEDRPVSGSLVQVFTKESNTEFVPVKA